MVGLRNFSFRGLFRGSVSTFQPGTLEKTRTERDVLTEKGTHLMAMLGDKYFE